jgi:hypothetical protein
VLEVMREWLRDAKNAQSKIQRLSLEEAETVQHGTDQQYQQYQQWLIFIRAVRELKNYLQQHHDGNR